MKLYLFIILIAPITFSQWEVGASYKIKNDIPENGIGINISRNLPIQRPDFGIKVRAEVNLFRQTETDNGIDKNHLSEDYNLNVIGNFFFKNFSPYSGFGIGYGKVIINQLNNGSLLINLLAGLSFPISLINPFIEIQGVNYFSDFDSSKSGSDISSFQIRGVVGVNFSFNTLRD